MNSNRSDAIKRNSRLLAGFAFLCGIITASAELSREVELYHWVDYAMEAPGAAAGLARWDIEGSCIWTHENGDTRRVGAVWYSGSGDTYIYRLAGRCRAAGPGPPSRPSRLSMGSS